MARLRNIWINPERISESGAKNFEVAGVDIKVELGPFDTPYELTGEYCDGRGEFVIELKYIDAEPSAKRPRVIEGVRFLEGRHTGKLLQISVPVNSSDMSDVAVIKAELFNAFNARRNDVVDEMNHITQTLNQSVAEKAINSSIGDLVGVEE